MANFIDTILLKTAEIEIAKLVHDLDCSMLLVIVSEDEKTNASHICKDFPLKYLEQVYKEIGERIEAKKAELN